MEHTTIIHQIGIKILVKFWSRLCSLMRLCLSFLNFSLYYKSGFLYRRIQVNGAVVRKREMNATTARSKSKSMNSLTFMEVLNTLCTSSSLTFSMLLMWQWFTAWDYHCSSRLLYYHISYSGQLRGICLRMYIESLQIWTPIWFRMEWSSSVSFLQCSCTQASGWLGTGRSLRMS